MMTLKRSLGLKIGLSFLIVALLPLLAISLFFFIQGRRVTRTTLHEARTQLISEVGVEVERTVFSAIANITSLAENPALKSDRSGEEEKLDEMLKIQDLYGLFEDITLINPEGIVLVSTTYDFRGEWGQKEWFKRAIKGEAVVSPAHVILDPFRLVMVFTAPIIGEAGGAKAVIAGQLNMEKLWEITDRVKVGQTGFVILADRKGNLIATPDRSRLLYKASPDVFAQPTADGEKDKAVFRDPAGTEKICHYVVLRGYRSYPGQGWRIGLIEETGEFFTLIDQIRRGAIRIVLAALVLLALLATILSRNIIRPIDKLARAAGRIAKGDLSTRVEVKSKDEIGALAAAFNTMVEDLQKTTVSRDYVESIFRTMMDPLVVYTPEGTISTVNRAAGELLGYRIEELIGRPVKMIFAEEDAPAMSGELRNFATHCLTCDGRKIPVLFSCSAMKGPDGAVESIVGTAKDITERERFEEELLRAQKLESVGILAGGIAHDFNNILTPILGNISLVKLKVDPGGNISRVLSEAEAACWQAKDLTQQLLTFSKGGQPIRELMSIAGLIRETAKLSLSGSRARCEFSLAPDLWPVEIDRGQINQVINNLIINADQAMPRGGSIRVSAANVIVDQKHGLPLAPGRYVRIMVADQGIGIPEENIDRIFDPFFSTKRRGSGLGLATAYFIVKNHNGLITVESELGVGTDFYLYLPASGRKIEEKPGPEQSVTYGEGRVLIMDDEEFVRKTVGRMIDLLGYEVEEVSEGAEAVERYRQARAEGRPFVVVILDLTVPGGMGGEETLKAIREVDPGVKAIVFSGYSTDAIMSDYKRHGFAGIITKPFRIEALGEVLSRVIKGDMS